MSISKLSYERIRGKGGELQSASTQMNDILNEVKTLLNKVGDDATWSGTSASDAKATFNKLTPKFDLFVQSVKGCATALDKVVSNFEQADAAIRGGLN